MNANCLPGYQFPQDKTTQSQLILPLLVGLLVDGLIRLMVTAL
jgi:hypothetical protein